MVAVTSSCHPTDQIILGTRGERENQKKLRLFLSGQRGYHVRRLHIFGLPGLAEQIVRNFPDIFLVVKNLGIAHMKSPVGLRLSSEKCFWIARMAPDVGGHFRGGLEKLREQMFVRLNDRVT